MKNDLFAGNEMSNSSLEVSNSNNTNVAIVLTLPTPIIKQQGTIKGINSAVKFEKDFETSLKIQKVPDVWFEYVNEDNKTVQVKIPAKAKQFIEKRWINTLQYTYQNQRTADRAVKFNISRNYINDAAVFATKIGDLPIVTPLEKRNISEEEAFGIMKLTAKLAIERYKELQKMTSQTNSPKISE